MAACKNRRQACHEEIAARAEADCLRGHEEICEQRYDSCMSDPGKLFMGQVSAESECIGIHVKCRKSAAEECATAVQDAEGQCTTQFELCAQSCRNGE